MSPLEPTAQPADSLFCHYSTQPVDTLLRADDVLAVISSGPACTPGEDPRHYHNGLVSLSQPETHEVWSTSGVVRSGSDGHRRWSQSDSMLFVAQWVDDIAASSQRDAICETYLGLLEFIHQRGYPHIARMWNYMPHINSGDGDRERYRQFCLGRQQAFARYEQNSYPSACALGHAGAKTVVYLLAGNTPVEYIENPRQQSAYNYPREYGPASPSFARASLVNLTQGMRFFISGTASIVGHQTHFADDLSGQLQTTFDNIDALLSRCAYHAGMSEPPSMSILKVYIRNPDDYDTIAARVSAHFPGVPAQFLQADICRSELLVEIDGLCELPVPAAVSLPAKSQRA